MNRLIVSALLAFCSTVSVFSFAYAATPVASYSFDEVSGLAVDSSGNGNSLTLNGATRVTGKYGKGVTFSSGQKVTRIVSPQTALSGSVTIEAWIKPGMLPTSAKPIVVKSTRASSNYLLSIEGNKLLWTWGGGSYYHYSTGIIQSNVWQHVAVTYDSVTQKVVFYINGNKSGEDQEKFSPTAITGPLYVGSSDGSEYFNGTIDDVRIYNAALSQSEIKSDMSVSVGTVVTTPPITPLPNELPPMNQGGSPTNISLPVISGVFAVGSQLRVSNGEWSNTPHTFTYQVLRNGVPVSTVSTNTYTVTSSDIGSVLSWKVIATNSIGSTSVITGPFGSPFAIDPPNDVLPPIAVGSIGTIISSMAPNSWRALPNTKMKDVCPAPYDYWKCQAVLSAWGGGTFDAKRGRMLVFGGGHGDSWYNNIFSFDVSAMKWSRLTEMPADVTGTTYPTHWYDMRPERCGFMPKKRMTVTSDVVDGNYFFASKCFVEPILSQLDFQQPRSAHTYGELFMDTINDRFCSLASSYWPSGQTGSQVNHCYNFSKGTWERAANRPSNVGAGRGSTALDSQGNVWSLPGAGGYLGKYTPSTNSWTSYGYINYESIGGSDIDRKRNHLYTAHTALAAPAGAKITLRRWNLNDASSLRSSKTYIDISTTGDIPTIADVGNQAGFVYADAHDKFFLWGNGLVVYVLDPKTMIWTKFTGTGDNPGSGQKNGTYGRFRYSSAHGAFVLVNSITSDVYIYKPSTAGTIPPTPTPIPPVVPPVDVVTPTTPLNFSANIYLSNVNLSWTASSDNVGIAGYLITRNGSPLNTTTGTSYQDKGLASGTYSYTVTAYDAAGNKSAPSSLQTVTVTIVAPPVVPPPTPSGDTITSITLTSPITQKNSPFSIGQPFRQGDIPSGLSVISSVPNFQAVIKTRWADGSAKFAILSGRVDLVANTPFRIDIKAGTPVVGTILTEALLKSQNTNMLIDFQGVGKVELSSLIGKVATYSSALNQFTAGKTSDWIVGSEMSSWIYSSPVGSDPTLTAWFEVRVWKDGQVEILPWLENGFLKKKGITEKIGHVTVSMSGVEKFSSSLSVYHHTRTPLVSGTTFSYWLGADSKVSFKHDTSYFQKTKLVPTYSATLALNSSVLTSLVTSYTPFAQSNFPNGIGAPGYHPSIGLLPSWDVAYLTSGADSRALASVRVNAYSAGRYGTHYRDEKTNLPFRFSSYPTLVINGANSGITSTGMSSIGETTPTPSGKAPPAWSTSHAPSVGYLAYLLEGRYYFMEESQFAGTLEYLKQNDSSRQKTKGILLTNAGANTTRGVGWGLRAYAHAELATPDNSSLKSEFTNVINENINYYYEQYVAKPNNPQGFAAPYSDYSAGDGVYMHSSWMEDFLTAAFGYILDVKSYAPEYSSKLVELFNWKAQSIIGRLGQPGVANEYDFRDAAVYTLAVAPSDTANWSTGSGPWYKNWGEIYRATMKATAGTAEPNKLRGAYFPEGSSYWGDLQPAIAYAVTNNVPGAAAAYARMTGASNWSLFVTSVKGSPEWSVIPSSVSVGTIPPTPVPTNYCSTSLPSCSGTSCSLTHNASSVNQSWVLNAGSCGFSCTNGYTGPTCLTPPTVTPPPTPIPPAPTSTGPLPLWVSSLPLWQWYEIPNTALSSVEPSVRRLGVTGPESKITTWNGATVKRKGSVYMLGAAGGHGDYAGNEVDALALNVATPKWVELHEASKNSDIIDKAQFYLDNRPAATHTYYTTQFIDALDRMIVFGGGGLNGLGFPKPPADWPYFGSRRSFSFNMATKEWDSPDYVAQYPGDGDATAALAVKHPVTGDFYYSRSYGTRWYKWTQSTNIWTKLPGVSRSIWYAGAAIDPLRNRMLIVGGYTPMSPVVTNLDGISIATTFKGLGADVLKVGNYPGVIYDEVNDNYLVVYNSDTSIKLYRVNASTWEVDVPITTGSTPAARPNGIQNSAQYVPELGGIVIANSYRGNVYFMRTSGKSSALPVSSSVSVSALIPDTILSATLKTAPKPLPIEPVSGVGAVEDIQLSFYRTLASNMTGSDVYVLQTYLKKDAELSFTAVPNGVYGPMTEQAVKKFQVKYGIVVPEASTVTGYGVFGPKTQAKFLEVFKG